MKSGLEVVWLCLCCTPTPIAESMAISNEDMDPFEISVSLEIENQDIDMAVFTIGLIRGSQFCSI